MRVVSRKSSQTPRRSNQYRNWASFTTIPSVPVSRATDAQHWPIVVQGAAVLEAFSQERQHPPSDKPHADDEDDDLVGGLAEEEQVCGGGRRVVNTGVVSSVQVCGGGGRVVNTGGVVSTGVWRRRPCSQYRWCRQ